MENCTENDTLSAAVADHTAQAVAVTAELEEFFSHVRARHAHIVHELRELSAGMPGLCQSFRSLRENSQRLEEVYKAIDELQSTMDQINEFIHVVYSALKDIDCAPDVAGKMSSLLTSFGVVLHSDRASAGLWSRVPQYTMLNSRTPKEFMANVHATFKQLYQTKV